MKFYKSVGILSASFLIISCSSKSPEEYGKEYCECMKEYNGNMKKCKDILDDAKSDFGSTDEDVKQAFIDSYQSCMKDD